MSFNKEKLMIMIRKKVILITPSRRLNPTVGRTGCRYPRIEFQVLRSAGIPDAGVTSAREEAEQKFLEVLSRGTGDVVTLTARAERREYWFELEREGWTQTAHQSFG